MPKLQLSQVEQTLVILALALAAVAGWWGTGGDLVWGVLGAVGAVLVGGAWIWWPRGRDRRTGRLLLILGSALAVVSADGCGPKPPAELPRSADADLSRAQAGAERIMAALPPIAADLNRQAASIDAWLAAMPPVTQPAAYRPILDTNVPRAAVAAIRQDAGTLTDLASATNLDVVGPLAAGRLLAAANETAGAEWQAEAAKQHAEADRQKARADGVFSRTMNIIAAVCAALSLLVGGLAIYALVRADAKGAVGAGIAAGVLMAFAAALWFVVRYWLWILGGVGLTLAALAIYMAVKRIKFTRAVGAVVRGVEDAGQMGAPVKAAIAAAAGDALPAVRAVVRSIKRAEGIPIEGEPFLPPEYRGRIPPPPPVRSKGGYQPIRRTGDPDLDPLTLVPPTGGSAVVPPNRGPTEIRP